MPFTLLHDSACPFCRREIRALRMLDRRRKLVVVDIADPAFDPAAHGLTRAEVAGAFCGVLPDGRVTRGPETVRAAFREIGLGWLAAWTGWRWTRPAVDGFYRFYARNRVRWGRRFGRKCEGGSCALGEGHATVKNG